MQAQAVTDVVEADGVGELGVEQRDDMAPVTEGPSETFQQVAGQLGDQVGRNQMAKLPQHGQLGTGWRALVFLFHPDRVAGNPASANLFPHRLWDGCETQSKGLEVRARPATSGCHVSEQCVSRAS